VRFCCNVGTGHRLAPPTRSETKLLPVLALNSKNSHTAGGFALWVGTSDNGPHRQSTTNALGEADRTGELRQPDTHRFGRGPSPAPGPTNPALFLKTEAPRC